MERWLDAHANGKVTQLPLEAADVACAAVKAIRDENQVPTEESGRPSLWLSTGIASFVHGATWTWEVQHCSGPSDHLWPCTYSMLRLDACVSPYAATHATGHAAFWAAWFRGAGTPYRACATPLMGPGYLREPAYVVGRRLEAALLDCLEAPSPELAEGCSGGAFHTFFSLNVPPPGHTPGPGALRAHPGRWCELDTSLPSKFGRVCLTLAFRARHQEQYDQYNCSHAYHAACVYGLVMGPTLDRALEKADEQQAATMMQHHCTRYVQGWPQQSHLLHACVGAVTERIGMVRREIHATDTELNCTSVVISGSRGTWSEEAIKHSIQTCYGTPHCTSNNIINLGSKPHLCTLRPP